MEADDCIYADIHRRILDEDKPDWTEERVWCPPHRQFHTLVRQLGQIAMLGQDEDEQRTTGRRPAGVLLADGKTLCFHGNGSAAVYGDCAYCGARLHAHQSDLAAVKSGKAEAGYLEEKCPACHRPNAVHAAYGLGGIRTTRLEAGAPAMQGKLAR